MFDKHMMSFAPIATAGADDRRFWQVVGGADLHGNMVELPTLPHRVVMYAHLKLCANKGSIRFQTPENEASITAVTSWLEQVTPPRGSAQCEPSSPTDQ